MCSYAMLQVPQEHQIAELAPHDGTRLFRNPWGKRSIVKQRTASQYSQLTHMLHPSHSKRSITSGQYTCLSDAMLLLFGAWHCVAFSSRRTCRQLGMDHSHRSLSLPKHTTTASQYLKRKRNRKQNKKQEMLLLARIDWHMHALLEKCLLVPVRNPV